MTEETKIISNEYAIEQVLQAELQTNARIEQSQREAAELVNSARQQAQRIEDRCRKRIGRSHQFCNSVIQATQAQNALPPDNPQEQESTADPRQLQAVIDSLVKGLCT
ncbi:MAG: hypothetical protein OEY28_03235 [Nitrospira sp.]|nr:hypothetical protein [Nitrospira sp.]